jgi:hypothetical protein
MGSLGNRADAGPGQNPAAKRCAARPPFSTPKKGRVGSRAQARDRSIRRKASRVEATSSLHWGGERAALAVQVVSGYGVERRRSRSVGRSSQGPRSIESAVARPSALSGAFARAARTTSSHRMVPVGGACRRQGTSEVGGISVVKALPAATTRGGSAWQTSKGVLPTGARAPKKSAGSVDAGGRKAARRGSKACTAGRRTEADEAKPLVDPSRPS